MKARKPQPEPITVPEPIVPLPGQMELFDEAEMEITDDADEQLSRFAIRRQQAGGMEEYPAVPAGV